MKLFQFSGSAVVQGNVYVATQVIAFPDDFDTAALPGAVVDSAPVFMDHADRTPPQE